MRFNASSFIPGFLSQLSEGCLFLFLFSLSNLPVNLCSHFYSFSCLQLHILQSWNDSQWIYCQHIYRTFALCSILMLRNQIHAKLQDIIIQPNTCIAHDKFTLILSKFNNEVFGYANQLKWIFSWTKTAKFLLTFLSAMYKASASLAKFSLICTPCRPLPSAANLLSNGIV